jgi:hypothetical protein
VAVAVGETEGLVVGVGVEVAHCGERNRCDHRREGLAAASTGEEFTREWYDGKYPDSFQYLHG